LEKLQEMRVYDVRPEAQESFLRFIEESYPGRFCASHSGGVVDAVRGADVIVTTTPSRRPIILNEWVRGLEGECTSIAWGPTLRGSRSWIPES